MLALATLDKIQTCKCVRVWKVMCNCMGGMEGDVSMCGGMEGDV